MMFASALSQMWVFAVYELLRTWRQQANELIAYADDLSSLDTPRRMRRMASQAEKLTAASSLSIVEDASYGDSFRRVEHDAAFVDLLRNATARILPVFRDVEAVRITLAKHEVPKTKSFRAQGPGYCRIDRCSGSMCWMIILKDKSAKIISRRDLADGCRALRDP